MYQYVSKYVRVFIRRDNQKSHDAPKKSRFADEIGESNGETCYTGGKVLQAWRSLGGNWNSPITFAYLIY